MTLRNFCLLFSGKGKGAPKTPDKPAAAAPKASPQQQKGKRRGGLELLPNTNAAGPAEAITNKRRKLAH